MIERKRMEQDGLFIDSPEHWETFEVTIYLYIKTYDGYPRRFCHFNIPIDIIRHLKLEHKEKILVAIKRSE